MTIKSLTPQALKLSSAERAQLASDLWASLEDPYDLQCELSEESAVELAINRDQQIESGEIQSVTHEEMMRRLRA